MQQKIAKHQSEINELKNQNTELEVLIPGYILCVQEVVTHFI